MKILNLLPKQQEVVASEAPVVILRSQRREGSTTTLFFKALAFGYDSVVFSNNTRQTRDHFCEWFSKLDINVHKVNNVFGVERIRAEHNGGFHITFIHARHFAEQVRLLGLNAGLWLWDDIHLSDDIDHKDVHFMIERIFSRKLQIVFSSDVTSCGWRNPRYEKGLISYDERGNMIADEVSWDFNLINWQDRDLIRREATRCDTFHYKDFVEVIG